MTRPAVMLSTVLSVLLVSGAHAATIEVPPLVYRGSRRRSGRFGGFRGTLPAIP